MKIILPILFVLSSTACQLESKKDVNSEKIIEPIQIIKGEYKMVSENLFQDQNKTIYFRTIDRSAITDNKEVLAIYSHELLYDTLIDNRKTYFEIELKQVVDPNSFRKVKKDGLITFYQDENHE